jgi:hypothetical protein
MFIICLHTNFHILSSNSSLVTDVNPKAKYSKNVRMAAMLFYTVQIILLNISCFLKIYFHTSVQDHISYDACLTSSYVRHVGINDCKGNENVRGWGGLQWHNVDTKFHKNRSVGLKVENGDTYRGHCDIISRFLFLRKGK